jgi:hypothetical protein
MNPATLELKVTKAGYHGESCSVLTPVNGARKLVSSFRAVDSSAGLERSRGFAWLGSEGFREPRDCESSTSHLILRVRRLVPGPQSL